MADHTFDKTAEFGLGDYLVRPAETVITPIADPTAAIRLEPKVMSVLVYLAEHAGEVVSRDALMDRVWPNVVVSDETLMAEVM